MGQLHQRGPVDGRACCGPRRQIGEAMLQFVDPLQGRVPARLEFTGHMALGRIDELMTPGSERGLVARRLQFTRHGLPNVVRRAGRLIDGKRREKDLRSC